MFKPRLLDLQESIVNELEKNYHKANNSDIWRVADNIENEIKSIVEKYIFEYLKKNLTGFKIIVKDSFEFSYNKKSYTINVSPDVKNTSMLAICIADSDSEGDFENGLLCSEIKLVGGGKIKKVSLMWPNAINQYLDIILEDLKKIIETIYSWLRFKLDSCIQDQVIIANFISSKLKVFFTGNEEIVGNIWFFVIKDNKGFYVLSQENINLAMEKFNNSSEAKTHGPIRLISEMLNLVMPFEKTLSLIPITQEKPVDFFNWPQKAGYSEDKQLLIKGERIIFTDDITIHPLLNSGKLKFIIMTPTKYSKIVYPYLRSNSEEINQTIKNRFNLIHRVLSNLTSSSIPIDYARIGELIGGILKANIN